MSEKKRRITQRSNVTATGLVACKPGVPDPKIPQPTLAQWLTDVGRRPSGWHTPPHETAGRSAPCQRAAPRGMMRGHAKPRIRPTQPTRPDANDCDEYRCKRTPSRDEQEQQPDANGPQRPVPQYVTDRTSPSRPQAPAVRQTSRPIAINASVRKCALLPQRTGAGCPWNFNLIRLSKSTRNASWRASAIGFSRFQHPEVRTRLYSWRKSSAHHTSSKVSSGKSGVRRLVARSTPQSVLFAGYRVACAARLSTASGLPGSCEWGLATRDYGPSEPAHRGVSPCRPATAGRRASVTCVSILNLPSIGARKEKYKARPPGQATRGWRGHPYVFPDEPGPENENSRTAGIAPLVTSFVIRRIL